MSDSISYIEVGDMVRRFDRFVDEPRCTIDLSHVYPGLAHICDLDLYVPYAEVGALEPVKRSRYPKLFFQRGFINDAELDNGKYPRGYNSKSLNDVLYDPDSSLKHGLGCGQSYPFFPLYPQFFLLGLGSAVR